MNNRILLLVVCFVIINCPALIAQDWTIGGNALAANSKFGSTTKRNIFFISGNKIRGTLTKDGDWGFGTTAPNVRFHINSDSGQSPFRVQVDGATKLYVDKNGGVSVGSVSLPPANGLFVSGNAGIGTTAPAVKLHVVGGSDASPSGGGFIVSGSTSAGNIAIDDNEIMARNAGAVSNLFLNNNGGDLIISGANSSGNVGIGTSSPGNRLHIKQSTANRAIEWEHESNANFWTLGIGTTTLNARFEFNGTGKGQISSTDGAYSQISDFRLKQDIKLLPQIMDKVMQLKPSEYFFKDAKADTKNKSIGFIAQEVEKVFPQLVRQEDGGFKWLSYADFSVIAIKAIQELQPVIEEQNKTIADLQQRLAMLESKLSGISGDNAKISENVIGARLEQNQPNPFNQSTIIRYQLPQGTSGQINIYDNKGILMKSFRANNSGQAMVDASDLKPGSYTYNLLVNGKMVASKKMVLLN